MGDFFGKAKVWFLRGFLTVILITGAVWIKENMEDRKTVTVLERNPPGMGDTKIHLEAWTEEGVFPVDIQIQERQYTEEELEDVFKRGKEWLDSVWLGENTASDNITGNLYFPTYIDELGLTVRWEVDNPAYIQSDGSLSDQTVLEKPQTIQICAILRYGDVEKVYTYEICLKTLENTKEKKIEKEIEKVIKTLDEKNPTEEKINLPTKFRGEQMTWYLHQPVIWPKVFLFGSVIVVLLYFAKEEKQMQQLKDRDKSLGLDYPDIVYQMILLIGAGMTIKNAWEKIVTEYEREKKLTGERRWGYEEMGAALREMNYGIAEIKAYENFGNRCGNQNYIRFSALLVQQMKRGAKGMNQLLMQEVTEAEILWRENCRKKTEEAGTKLLLPMILLMSVVFAVLMIPAFLSMSMG